MRTPARGFSPKTFDFSREDFAMDNSTRLLRYEKYGYETRQGEQIGRDPREMEISDLQALGHDKQPLLKAIREKCLDCCVYQPSEVRKCTAFDCALWPYRMRSNPFFGSNEAEDAEKEAQTV